ncbi:ROK family protein [Plantibacter sp. YIM 135347]|uniref:ROK family protein n=1 Tax=Plantibacter sp. YIM 135347 TaxID=3423919 RepID=UPI003D355EBD
MDYALAIDLGGTKVEAALVSADGAVDAATRFRGPTGAGASRDEVITSVVETARLAYTALGDGDRIVGVGIGSAGPIDLVDGTISPINLPAAADFDIVGAVSGVVDAGTTVALRLDGTCIALAEHWKGALRGTSNAMGIVVSTGIGGGIIINSQLVAGRSGNAGHLGQMQFRRRHPERPHAPWTLEGIASGTSTVRWARSKGWQGASGEELAADYAAGLPLARRAVRRSATAVGEALCSISTLLDLERVAVGGGFSRVAPEYLDLVQEAATESALTEYAGAVRVVPSGLDSDGPLIGAAALVLKETSR